MPRLQIGDFGGFIFDEIPYGRVETKDFKARQEYDGPIAEPTATPLQWHFAGTPHTIPLAIRLQYTYKKPYGGVNDAVGSLFLGYTVANPPSADAQAQAAAQLGSDVATLSAPNYETVTDYLPSRVREQESVAPTLKRQLAGVAVGTGRTQFDQLQDNGSPGGQPQAVPAPSDDIATSMIAWSRPMVNLNEFVRRFGPDRFKKWDTLQLFVDVDGPARENSSSDPFPLSRQELFGNQAKFEELIYWYFGGKVYTITKAIRVRANQSETAETLMIGFQGPSPYP